MQDDSPWKPPSDDAAAGRSAPVRAEEVAGGPVAPAAETGLKSPQPTMPTLPDAPPSAPVAGDGPASQESSLEWSSGLPPVAPTLGPPPAPPVAAPPNPAETWPTGFGDAVPPSDPVVTGPDDGVVVPSEPSDGSRRSTGLVIGAVAAVIAVVAAGIFAITNLTGSAEGGADTPNDLGLALLDAIENEDVLGVIDVLSPGERDVFRDPIVDLVAELKRLDVLSDDADLARILGVDVVFSNVSVESVSTNVDDITNIDMRADAVVSLDGAQVPIGSLITDNVPSEDLTEMRGTKLTQTEDFDVRLTAIEQDGRWYFSVFHTIAELARAEGAPGALIPVDGIGHAGGESPEAAVDALLDRLEALDLAGLVQVLNPGEAAALQRYAPLFIEEGQAALDEVPIDWSITSREFRVDGDGNTRTVMVDAIAIEGTIEETSFSVSLSDGCIRAEADGETFEQCQAEQFAALDEMLVDAPDAKRLIDTITEAFSDMEQVGLELREFDGAWYVSPTATFTEGLLAVLRALDRTELDAIIEQAPAAFDEFGEAFWGGFDLLPGNVMGLDEEFVFDEGAGSTSADDAPADDAMADESFDQLDDTGGVGNAGDYEEDPLDAAWSECYSEIEPTDATDCFTAVSAAGGPDLSLMPIQLRFPECGFTQSWYNDFYQLPDEEFIAAAEASRPCFLDLVAQGAVNEWELPAEILNLECFEGRNWYQVLDDPDYDTRYYECIDETTG